VKAKTIKATLRKKLNMLLASIEDEAVREAVAKNTIVTGGSIASMLLKEPVNDFDLYFEDRRTAFLVAQYYVGKFKPKMAEGIAAETSIVDEHGHEATLGGEGRIKIVIKSAGIASEEGTSKPYQYFEQARSEDAGDYVSEIIQDPGAIEDTYEATETAALATSSNEKPSFRPIFLSTNAITLSDKVQIILRFFGEPDKIHENYDFVHCTNYWKSWDDELVLRPAALEALLSRELRYVGSKYPICSLIRLRKFIARGWTINAGQVLKMCMQVSQLDLTDVRVLEDQLTGVDVAYFMQVVTLLKEKHPDKVDYAYLIEIIDRMF
jgi:hypothetical protein